MVDFNMVAKFLIKFYKAFLKGKLFYKYVHMYILNISKLYKKNKF